MSKELNNIIDYFFNISTKSPVGSEYTYSEECKQLACELCKRIYPYVVLGATLADVDADGTKICLTDHGERHVYTVLLRALKLLETGVKLNPYETYILIKAILIHDIGNIYGRKNHEVNSLKAIKLLRHKLGKDKLEEECITSIAWAHGGTPKDKISLLVECEKLFNNDVRQRLLAAILKFADELADERERCNDSQMEDEVLPLEAKIYHKYAYCLHSVSIDPDSIQLNFDLDEDDTKFPYKKEGKDILLIDEIYNRTFKTHLERLYCMRFLRPSIYIDRIKVTIKIRLNKLSEYKQPEFHIIKYELGEVGYPEEDSDSIFRICPDLKNSTGEKIKELLEEKI